MPVVAVNPFADHQASVNQPARKLVAITPSDTDDVATVVRAIYVGGAGNVAVIAADDSSAVTFIGVPAGAVIPVMAKRVMAAGTTATNLVGLM